MQLNDFGLDFRRKGTLFRKTTLFGFKPLAHLCRRKRERRKRFAAIANPLTGADEVLCGFVRSLRSQTSLLQKQGIDGEKVGGERFE